MFKAWPDYTKAAYKVVVQGSSADSLVEDNVAEGDGRLVEGVVADAEVVEQEQAFDGSGASCAGYPMQVLNPIQIAYFLF